MEYDERYSSGNVPSNIILESRRRLSITGVEEVISFDESLIVANTVCGTVVIRGNDMHMEKLSLDSGEINVEGSIDGMEYENEEGPKEGLFSRLFK